MGTFSHSLTVSSMDGERSCELMAVVDTGAAYTVVPQGTLCELGIQPRGRRRFLLADGRRSEMEFGEAKATVAGEQVTTLVIFGDDDAPALLGAYTLEGLALAVDPTEGRLVPAELILCAGLRAA